TTRNPYNRPIARNRRLSYWRPRHQPSVFWSLAKPVTEEDRWPGGQSPVFVDDERQKAAGGRSHPAARETARRPQPPRHLRKSQRGTHPQSSPSFAAQAPRPSSGCDVPHPVSTDGLTSQVAGNLPKLRLEMS